MRAKKGLDVGVMAWLVDKARNVGAVRAAAAVTAGGFKLDGGGWRFQGAI